MTKPSDLRRRLGGITKRVNRIKDQSGVEASTRFLAGTGAGTYGPRATGKSVEERTSRPVQREYYDRIVAAGVCVCCGSPLVLQRTPAGGYYHACSTVDGHLCYYIGLERDGTGHERLPEAA